jgi:hypothetical protein
VTGYNQVLRGLLRIWLFASRLWLEGFSYLTALEGWYFSDVDHSLRVEMVENEIDVPCVLNG